MVLKAKIVPIAFFVCASTALAQESDLYPEPSEISGALDGLPIDVQGVTLDMSAQEAAQMMEGEIKPGRWNFFNERGLEPARLIRDDLDRVERTIRDSNGVDFMRIDLSEWHSGNRPLRIYRNVNMDEGARPNESAFVSALTEKYGTPREIARPVRGVHYIHWTLDNGEPSADCEMQEIPRDIEDFYGSGQLERREQLLAKLDSGEWCAGHIRVAYKKDAADRVTYYEIMVQDSRAIIADTVNRVRVQEQMKATAIENARSDNEVAPDL